MSIVWKLINTVLVIVLLLLAVAFFLPRNTQLARSITIQAPPAALFDRLNTFQGFNEYSPWFDRDPRALYKWSGPTSGVGARMEWDSKNPQVGKGSQEIMASEPYRRVVTRLDFGAGGRNDAGWLIEPLGGGAKVTWTLNADAGLNPLNRWIGLFLERLVGPDYEKGLARLKIIAERDAAPPAAASAVIEVLDVTAMDIAYIATHADNTPDKDRISAEMGRAYSVIGAFLTANRLQMSGPPLAITHRYDANSWVFDAALPATGAAADLLRASKAGGAVRIGKTYAGKAVKATHTGPYTSLPDTYAQIQDYLRAHGMSAAGDHWEQYINDPGSTPRDKLVTDVYWPVRTP